MFRIVVASRSAESFRRKLYGDSLTIGRSASAGLTIPDKFLSRRHARLFRSGDVLKLEDLGSRNGTAVNGVPILEPTEVRPGDRIELGDFTLTIETDETESPVPNPTAPADRPPASLDASLLIPASELLGRTSDLDESALRGIEDRGGDLHLYIERLRLLDEVHRSLARSISLEELLDLILDRVFDELRPEEGVVILKREDGSYETVARRTTAEASDATFYSDTLIQEVAEKRHAALVLDAQTDQRFAEAASIVASGVKSIVAAPLAIDEESLGLIAMSSRLSVRQFKERDLELLVSLASVAALRLNNVSLAIEAAERQKLEAEIALARTIQERLLPTDLPAVPGYEIFAFNRPSQGVSGDLYQVLETDSSADVYVLLFDVSGKGLAASLLTATIEALSAAPIAEGLAVETTCALVNRRLEARTPPDRFATLFLARLSVSDGRFEYASAGHNPALLIRASGTIERLTRTGVPLGVLADGTFEARSLELLTGDLLVIYTDGITEAASPAGEEYGLDRLDRFCLERRSLTLQKLTQALERDVADFAAGTPYGDDQTLLLLRRTAAG